MRGAGSGAYRSRSSPCRADLDGTPAPAPSFFGVSALVVRDLFKTYPDGTRALRGVSLDVAAGMFGLLGPNGAGKSTLMRTIATLQRPDSGTVCFGDIDALAEPERLRATLGYLPQDFGLYPALSAEETLDHFATLKGVVERGERRELVEELLAQVNLWDHRRRRVGGFSGGMRQRLGLAIALAGSPRLLVLDEPTAGLDPEERRRLYNLLADIAADVVVVLSTHIVDDVEELCSALAIIDRGEVVLRADPREARAALRGRVWERVAEDALPAGALPTGGRLLSRRHVAGVPVVRTLADSPSEVPVGWTAVDPSLEDVYFAHVHRAGGDD